MIYNYQTNPEWMMNTMGITGDTLSDYGCLVTVIANIEQEMIMKEVKPDELNRMIKREGLYFGPGHKGKESYLKTDELLLKLGKKRVVIDHNQFHETPMVKHYVKISMGKSPHYVNVLKKIGRMYLIFDVYHGEVRYIEQTEIKKLYRIERI